MIENRDFSGLLLEAFPIEPLPAEFLWAKAKGSLETDVPLDLKDRISGRRWNEIAPIDWRMIGAPPVLSRLYLAPAAFAYYLPSILLGAHLDFDFAGDALEAIIPYNKHHVPRGSWWFEFVDRVSPKQREVLSRFLQDLRLRAWDEIGPANQHFWNIADSIWSRS